MEPIISPWVIYAVQLLDNKSIRSLDNETENNQ